VVWRNAGKLASPLVESRRGGCGVELGGDACVALGGVLNPQFEVDPKLVDVN